MTKKKKILDLAQYTTMGQLKDEIGKKSEELLRQFLVEYPNVRLLKQGRFHKELALDIDDYVITGDKVLAKATGEEIDVEIDETKIHLLTDIDKMIAKTLVILNAPEKITVPEQEEPEENDRHYDYSILDAEDLQERYRNLTRGETPQFIFLPDVSRVFAHETINSLYKKGYDFLSFATDDDTYDQELGILFKRRKNFRKRKKRKRKKHRGKMKSKLPLVAILIVVAIGAWAVLSQTSAPPSFGAAKIRLPRTIWGGEIVPVADIPTTSGIENVYIMEHKTNSYDNTENLRGSENLLEYENVDAVITANRDIANIPYDNAFDIVVSIKVSAENVVNLVEENIMVELALSGAFTLAPENSANENEFTYLDNSPNDIYLNVIWDNNGNGYTLSADAILTIDSVKLFLWDFADGGEIDG